MNILFFVNLLLLSILYLAAEIRMGRRINEMYEAIQTLLDRKTQYKDEQILLYTRYVIEQFKQNKRPKAYSEWLKK